MRTQILAALLLAVASAAHAQSYPPGWGDSTQLPTGTPWIPPAGIVVEKQIMPYNMFDEDDCKEEGAKSARPLIGHGGMVQICMVIRNTNPRGRGDEGIIDVIIPAGLIVISERSSDQHGILLVKQVVQVRPGQKVQLPMSLICMNSSKDHTSLESRYRLGPITDHPEARKLIAFLADKRVPVNNAAGSSGVGRIQRGKPIDQLTYDTMASELERDL
ncbi:MAG: hypothetical protein MT490_03535 [Sphingomonas sp.]|uniref:hypothetical protein n=1 Tax=Sphingomonas sp. TaxID=28214 RepID=UPI0022730A1E|nr:hypothetical protein [Sphingomonas sp.]MCX8474849.1 hypothetical protein [Sphingomonas sp.]